MIARASLFAVGLAAVAQPVLAAEPLGQWKIEPSDARCVAVRQYGSADKPTTLALKGSVRGSAFQLAVLRSGFQKKYAQTDANISVDGQNFSSTALSYPIAGNKRRVTHLVNLDTDTSESLRSAAELRVTVTEGINESFAVGMTNEAWTAMQDCVSRLRQDWNVGEGNSDRIASYARGNLSGIFTEKDYPLAMILADKSGSTKFGLLIDETGKVKDCTIVEPSGVAVLDARACAIISERAKFSPALSVDGKPIKSSMFPRISWKLVL